MAENQDCRVILYVRVFLGDYIIPVGFVQPGWAAGQIKSGGEEPALQPAPDSFSIRFVCHTEALMQVPFFCGDGDRMQVCNCTQGGEQKPGGVQQ